MKNRMRNLVFLSVIIIVGMLILFFNDWSDAGEGGCIRVGVVLPLSGDWGLFGQRMLNGIHLWQADHPDAHVKVFVEDGKSNVSKSIAAFNKLTQIHRIQACVTGTSPVVLGIAPLADSQKVFTVNIGAINPKIKTLSPYMFTIVPDADVEASFLADFMINNLNAHSCYILWRNDDSGLGMLHSFRKAYGEAGGKIIGDGAVLSIDGIKDELMKLKASGAQTVFIPVNGDLAAHVIKQAVSIGLGGVQWIGYAATETPELTKELNGIDVKLIFSTFAFSIDEAVNEKSAKFISDYRLRYREDPSLYSATCYDALDLIYSSCQMSNTNVCDAVETRKHFEGVSGRLEICKNFIRAKMSLKMLKENRFMTYRP